LTDWKPGSWLMSSEVAREQFALGTGPAVWTIWSASSATSAET
jgi:hypothetical protein